MARRDHSTHSDAGAPWDEMARTAERLTDPARSILETASPELAGVHRASPLTIVSAAAGGLGAIAGLILLAIVRGFVDPDPQQLRDALLFAAALFGISLAASIITWRTRTWELTGEGLVLASGLITRKRLVIPYGHIHAVGASSSLVQRVLGLITLDLDTGAAETEGDAASIKGLQTGLARALQAELFRRKAAAGVASTRTGDEGTTTVEAAPRDRAAACEGTEPMGESTAPAGENAAPANASFAAPEEPIASYRLSRRQLLLAAASETRVLGQAAAFAILLVQGVNFLHESRLLNLSNTADDLAALPATLIIAASLALVAASLVAGLLISFAVGLVSYAGFRVQRFSDRIVLERGLLDRVARTIASERIQYLRIEQGLVRQALGYAQVRAVVVASPGGDAGGSAGDVVLHPFIRLDEVEPFLAQIAPAWAGILPHAVLRPLPRAAARRQALRTGAGIIAVATVLAAGAAALHRFLFAAGPSSGTAGIALAAGAAAISIIVAIRLALNAVLRCRTSRIGYVGRCLIVVQGGTTRRTSLIPRRSIQHASYAASPFQARAGVATFSCSTAATGTISLRDVSAEDAAEVIKRCLTPFYR